MTSAGLAFSHGANDAQKSMGMLTLLLLGGFHRQVRGSVLGSFGLRHRDHTGHSLGRLADRPHLGFFRSTGFVRFMR